VREGLGKIFHGKKYTTNQMRLASLLTLAIALLATLTDKNLMVNNPKPKGPCLPAQPFWWKSLVRLPLSHRAPSSRIAYGGPAADFPVLRLQL
jgi:hypothetical protein